MRELSTENSGDQFIQYRGFHDSVTMDTLNLLFESETVDLPYDHGQARHHRPKPVASRDEILAGEAPENAVARELAEAITDGDLANPQVCWGVACEYHDPETGEVCDEVFDTRQGLNGHLHTHYHDPESGGGSDSATDGADAAASDEGSEDPEVAPDADSGPASAPESDGDDEDEDSDEDDAGDTDVDASESRSTEDVRAGAGRTSQNGDN